MKTLSFICLFFLSCLSQGFLHAQAPDSFNPNANNPVISLVQQSDGKILMKGAFTTVGGVVRNRVA